MPFEIGNTYSRALISGELGGSIQSYLPENGGRVVCGCFDGSNRMNPNAPEEILFGTDDESRTINRTADMVFRQGQAGEAIPVFVKRRTNEWEYVGEYLCIGITRDPRVVANKLRQWPQRGEFHGVLRFESVSPVPNA